MLDELPRDFQASVISVWLTNSSYGQWSDSGVQQGDPLGPLLFSLAINDIVSSMKSNFNLWYLDDATIVEDQRSVCDDKQRCSCMLADIGLFLNPSKSELVNLCLDETVCLRETSV